MIRRCPRKCGGQMFRESIAVGNGGKWRRAIIAPELETDRSVVSYEPPPVGRRAMWVCLQCGYEVTE